MLWLENYSYNIHNGKFLKEVMAGQVMMLSRIGALKMNNIFLHISDTSETAAFNAFWDADNLRSYVFSVRRAASIVFSQHTFGPIWHAFIFAPVCTFSKAYSISRRGSYIHGSFIMTSLVQSFSAISHPPKSEYGIIFPCRY